MLTPDTIVPDPSNPQSFNRYSYVRNNPVNFADPTGHRECGANDDCSDPLEPYKPPPSKLEPQIENHHPAINLQDWETNALAAVITLENNGLPSDFIYYAAWILRNRYESNEHPDNVADIVFGQGQWDAIPTWFSQHETVLNWLTQYPDNTDFSAQEIAERFATTVANRFPEQFAESVDQINIVFGESNLVNPVPGGLYVGHVDTRVLYLELARLENLAVSEGDVVYGFINGPDNTSLVWTNHNSSCCYRKYTP